jgi:hypothetical protein
MKKIALALLVAAFAAAPAAAASKHKKMTAQEKANAKAMEVNEQSWRIIRDGAPLILPSWAIPIYFGTHMDEQFAPKKNKKKKK